MNEEKAAAILLANIKGHKKKPSKLTEVAEACRFLLDKWGLKKTAKFLNVSQYQLIQIDKINKLNSAIQKLIDNGKLGIDASYQIWRLKKSIRTEAALECVDLTSHEVRQLVHLLRNDEELTVKEAKKITKKALRNEFHLLTIPLSLQTHKRLSKIALKSKKEIHQLIVEILENFVKRN